MEDLHRQYALVAKGARFLGAFYSTLADDFLPATDEP